jgi:hypothetical protein
MSRSGMCMSEPKHVPSIYRVDSSFLSFLEIQINEIVLTNQKIPHQVPTIVADRLWSITVPIPTS